MYEIRLAGTIKGRDIIHWLKLEYESLDNLKKLYKEDKKDNIIRYHLEEWEYYRDKLDENVKHRRVLFTDDYPIGKIELELLNSIKTDKPESIRELARLVGKDIKSVQPKVNALAKQGFILLKNGSKNNKIPVFPYDYLEIVIGKAPFPK